MHPWINGSELFDGRVFSVRNGTESKQMFKNFLLEMYGAFVELSDLSWCKKLCKIWFGQFSHKSLPAAAIILLLGFNLRFKFLCLILLARQKSRFCCIYSIYRLPSRRFLFHRKDTLRPANALQTSKRCRRYCCCYYCYCVVPDY